MATKRRRSEQGTIGICAVEGCGPRIIYARGLCNRHYQNARLKGQLDRYPRVRIIGDFEERFWSKVDKNGPVSDHRPDLGPCWVWVSILKPAGYGQFHEGVSPNRALLAHRVAYELLVGPVPDGLQIDHLCRVRRCVNPGHLEPVTPAENTRRGAAVITHCPAGHPYDEENTRVRPNGHRGCNTCNRASARRQWLRRKAEREAASVEIGPVVKAVES